YQPPVYPPPRARTDLFMPDSAFGYHLWPLSRTCMRYPANSRRMVALISNSDGFASSRELGEPDPRPRVLVTGDSFTFGLGVNEGTRFTEVLEDLEPRWRVDNMGMMGWGLDLMVRALEALGEKAQPTVVVLAVFADDLARLTPQFAAVNIPYTKFELVDGKLADAPPYKRTLWRRFYLSELVKSVRDRAGGTHARQRYPLNEALLNRFHDLTRELNATPVVLFLPAPRTIDLDRERRAFLSAWAETISVIYRDLTVVLHGVGVEKTYISDDQHWNEYGHEVAARALHELLADSVLQGKAAHVDTRALPPAAWHKQRFDFCNDRSDSESPSAQKGRPR
ncbi:MAG: SGNH/GDSL hydrolase family protein, partial [Gemmatimonadaceae bacterium]